MRGVISIGAAAVLLAVFTGALWGQGQPPAGAQRQQQQAQQQAMQRQMAQMQQMMQQMDQVAMRAQRLSQAFGEQAERAQSQLRQQHQLLQQFCDSLGISAHETHRNMERLQQMLHDPALAGDRDMERDMDRLREHVQAMTGNMDEMLGTMDRVQQRLRDRDSR